MFDWHKILEQLAVVMTVPGPFVVAVLIVGGLIWLAVNWSYNSVIASKNGQIELLDRQVADYKSKLQGASPDEAKARIDALEARLKLIEPRRLAGEPRRKFASILSAEPKSSIAIISEASGDNLQLAADFAAVFRSANWLVTEGQVMGLGSRPPHGIALSLPDPTAPAPDARLVMNALDGAGFSFDLRPLARRPDTARIEILISTP